MFKNINFNELKFKLSVKYVFIWYLLIYPIYNFIGILSINLQEPFVPVSNLDSYVIFTPNFVYAYVLMFFLPIATLGISFCNKVSIKELRSFYLSQIALLLLCYIFYLTFPSTAESIQVDLGSFSNSIALSMVGFLYEWGVPYNAFPSYHVAPLIFTALFMYEKCKYRFLLVLPLLIAPILATVYIKYHFVMDILGGVIFGIFAYFVIHKRLILKFIKQQNDIL